MTIDQARAAYDGATLTVADEKWRVVIDRVLASQTSSAYHLYFHLTKGAERIDGLEVQVKTPETSPEERVLQIIQGAFDRSWLANGEALVIVD